VERRKNEKHSQALPTETAQESYGKLTNTDIQREGERESALFVYFSLQLVEIIDQITAKFKQFVFLIKTVDSLII